MQTIRARLTLHHLLVLALGMSLAAALAWWAVSGLYIEAQRQNLLAQARLVAAGLDGAALPQSPQPYSQTANLAPGIHTRLLSEGGAVVVGLPPAEPFVQVPAAEGFAPVAAAELLRRPEIESALQGIPAAEVRRVLGPHRVLYAAAPVYAADGRITGIAYLASPLPSAGLPPNLLLQLAGAALLAGLLASLAGGWLARQIARPLEGLSQAADGLAKGDLDARVPADSRIRELHGLGRTFNDMAESLRRSDETRKAFIADVAHELRTPLTVIKGTVETLEDGALDDAEGRGPLLASMGRETERLIRLVNELLLLVRADAGQLQLELEFVDAAGLARLRCETLSPLAGRADVILEVVDRTNGASRVLADPDRLSQVFDNLLDNAIRHSPAGAAVTITIAEADDGIECCVADRGPGIPAEHLPRVFDRFYRVDRSRDRARGGNGLGLAIVRALILAQGGRIAAHSDPGRGTAITFRLPGDRG